MYLILRPLLADALSAGQLRSTSAMLAIIRALDNLPKGYSYWQREDGLRCEPGVITLRDWEFKQALRRLVKSGRVERSVMGALRNSIPFYRLKDKDSDQ